VAGAIIGVAAGTVVALTLSAVGIANTRITVLPFAVSFAACILIGVGFGLQPARRAARVDPATTLREQRI
jgi:putative ABC transport system permease protein